MAETKQADRERRADQSETKQRGPKQRGRETRERILDVALELFIQHGYEKTSLRDIAERLGITKAALYYYFERKEEILLELHLRLHAIGSEVVDEVEQIEDGPARVAAWPAVMNTLIGWMVENRELLLLHHRNPSAMEALYRSDRNRLENEDLEQRIVRILSSPAIPPDQRVRMSCAVGAITETLVESGEAFDDLPPAQLADLLRSALSDLLREPL